METISWLGSVVHDTRIPSSCFGIHYGPSAKCVGGVWSICRYLLRVRNNFGKAVVLGICNGKSVNRQFINIFFFKKEMEWNTVLSRILGG